MLPFTRPQECSKRATEFVKDCFSPITYFDPNKHHSLILGSTATLPGSVSDIWLLQPGVFRSGLFEDRAVIGVFPERKEIVVGGLGLIFVTRRMPRAA